MNNTRILAVDPGTDRSGWVVLDGQYVIESGVDPNEHMLGVVSHWGAQGQQGGVVRTLAIEMIASYGMAVGREVFETCVWIGRFIQAYMVTGGRDPIRVFRKDVKLHLCGSPRAKDPNIRQALLDMFPATGGGKTPQVGTKAQPGPLFGVSSHVWAALGVAVTVRDGAAA